MPLDKETLERAKLILSNNTYDPVDMYLECHDISRKLFKKHFKESTGFFPSDYRNYIQKKQREDFMLRKQVEVVESAKPLLIQGDMSVQQIANELGVNRVKLFRYFKSVAGVSPKQYQKKNIEETKKIKIISLVNSLVSSFSSRENLPFEIK